MTSQPETREMLMARLGHSGKQSLPPDFLLNHENGICIDCGKEVNWVERAFV